MTETVNLVLYPEIKEGEAVDEVKEKLAKTLSVDRATVDSWYSTDNPTAILKDVDEGTATKYVEAINQCGAQCNLQPSGEDKSAWSLEQMMLHVLVMVVLRLYVEASSKPMVRPMRHLELLLQQAVIRLSTLR